MKKIQINSIKPIHIFIHEIETLVNESKIDYIDAVLYYCEKNNMEIETAAALIRSSGKIKAKIQLEAEEINCLPKTARLPI